jgi:hypothetical protein
MEGCYSDFQLQNEVKVYLNNWSVLSSHLQDTDFLTKSAYLGNIFDKTNSLNMPLHRCNTNVMVLSDKVNGLMNKLGKRRVKNGNVAMFPLLCEYLEKVKESTEKS